jgi:hypothetical protein
VAGSGANGALRDMVCRGMPLMLERAGQITLPPVSYVRHDPLSRRTRPQPVLKVATPIEDRLGNLQPLASAPDQANFNMFATLRT